jgi:hypothetical protein
MGIGMGLKYGFTGPLTTGWTTGTVDSTADWANGCSIAINASKTIYISYADSINYKLRCAYKAIGATTWTTQEIPGISDVEGDIYNGGTTSIAVNPVDNKVHIVFYAKDPSKAGNPLSLRYVTNKTGSWVAETIDSSVDNVGQYCSIKIDATGKIHISYYNGSALKYATRGP